MKLKLFLALSLFGFLAQAQTAYTITPSKTVSFTAPFNNVTVSDIYMTNTDNTATLNMTWELVSVNVPSGWDYSMCDLGTCYAGIPQGPSNMSTAAAGASAFLGLNIDPVNIAGYGEVKVRVYVTGTSPSTADTLTWQITASAVQVEEIGSGGPVSVYPNPFADKLNIIVANADVSSAHVTDALGRRIMNLQLTGKSNAIDFSMLPKGMYLLHIVTQDKHLLKRIVKD